MRQKRRIAFVIKRDTAESRCQKNLIECLASIEFICACLANRDSSAIFGASLCALRKRVSSERLVIGRILMRVDRLNRRRETSVARPQSMQRQGQLITNTDDNYKDACEKRACVCFTREFVY